MLLDIFKMIFEADTKKAEEGIKKAEKSTEDLVKEFLSADKAAEKLGGSIKDMAKNAIGALGAALAVASTVSGALGRAEDIAAIESTSNALNIAVEDVDAFGKAMTRLGGDAQGARDSLTDMAESIGEAMQDVESGRAKTFAALGVDLRNVDGSAINAAEGMLRLAESVEGMSKGEAVFRIKELGITDNRTVEALLKGRKELERLLKVQKEANPLTAEQVKRAKELTETMGGWKNATSNAAAQFFDMLIPALTKVIGWLTKIVDWAGEHKDFVVGFFIAIAGVVAAVYLPAMISAAAATLAATWPILAIGAAIVAAAAAFALIYDDIMNFIDGNDSMIGQLITQYPIIGDVINTLVAAFKQLMEWGGVAFEFLKSGAASLLEGFQAFGNGIIAVFEFIGAMWKAQFDFIMAGVDMVKNGLTSVAEFFGFGGGGEDSVAAANQQLNAASTNPMNAVSSNAISNTANNSKETNVQVGQVTVQTQATDAQGISQSVGGELQTQLKNLEAETATGVDR